VCMYMSSFGSSKGSTRAVCSAASSKPGVPCLSMQAERSALAGDHKGGRSAPGIHGLNEGGTRGSGAAKCGQNLGQNTGMGMGSPGGMNTLTLRRENMLFYASIHGMHASAWRGHVHRGAPPSAAHRDECKAHSGGIAGGTAGRREWSHPIPCSGSHL